MPKYTGGRGGALNSASTAALRVASSSNLAISSACRASSSSDEHVRTRLNVQCAPAAAPIASIVSSDAGMDGTSSARPRATSRSSTSGSSSPSSVAFGTCTRMCGASVSTSIARPSKPVGLEVGVPPSLRECARCSSSERRSFCACAGRLSHATASYSKGVCASARARDGASGSPKTSRLGKRDVGPHAARLMAGGAGGAGGAYTPYTTDEFLAAKAASVVVFLLSGVSAPCATHSPASCLSTAFPSGQPACTSSRTLNLPPCWLAMRWFARAPASRAATARAAGHHGCVTWASLSSSESSLSYRSQRALCLRL